MWGLLNVKMLNWWLQVEELEAKLQAVCGSSEELRRRKEKVMLRIILSGGVLDYKESLEIEYERACRGDE